jgi:tellurite resistance protein TehA-like permease
MQHNSAASSSTTAHTLSHIVRYAITLLDYIHNQPLTAAAVATPVLIINNTHTAAAAATSNQTEQCAVVL